MELIWGLIHWGRLSQTDMCLYLHTAGLLANSSLENKRQIIVKISGKTKTKIDLHPFKESIAKN